MKKALLVASLFLHSCTSLYHKFDLNVLQQVKTDTNMSMIYGTYSFSNKFCFLPSRIGLNIQKVDKLSPDTYFAFENENGDFIFPLDPGKYKIVSLGYFSDSTYESYDVQALNYIFEAKPGKIIYLGNFTPNISFDVEYIYWGIASIKDSFEEDKALFIKNYSFPDSWEIENLSLEKLGKIKKLKYSPASPSTNI